MTQVKQSASHMWGRETDNKHIIIQHGTDKLHNSRVAQAGTGHDGVGNAREYR